MKNKDNVYDLIFLGLTQDCEKTLPGFFREIEKISKYKNIKVIIGENASNDFTFDLIQKQINKSEVYDLVDTTFIEKFDDRIKRLALARQALKEYLITQKFKSKFICVIDLDEVLNETFNLHLLDNLCSQLIQNEDKYFGISVSSKPYYYDILNFENEDFPNFFIKNLQNNKSLKSYKNRKKFIYDVQKKLSNKFSFECISAFNGLCLYQYKEYILSNYTVDEVDQTPEHLLFNRYLNKILKKKILVSSNYFNMPEEHKPLNNIISFITEKFVKYFYIYINKYIK